MILMKILLTLKKKKVKIQEQVGRYKDIIFNGSCVLCDSESITFFGMWLKWHWQVKIANTNLKQLNWTLRPRS